MTNDEVLIRQAIAAEAEQAVDSSIVLAELHGGRRGGRKAKRRRTGLVAIAGVAVAAGIVGVVVPLTLTSVREATPAATNPAVAPPSTMVDQNVLLLGMDDFQHPDAIMLVRLNASGSVRILSLPRDTAVPGAKPTKLNSLYPTAASQAQQTGKDPVGEGAKATAAKVTELTGVPVDDYVVVGMGVFERLSTAVGGVEVCLRAATKDREADASFPAGPQIVMGKSALAFVRQRHGLPNGDYGRIIRQQEFLRSVASKLAAGKADLLGLATLVRDNVAVSPGLDLAGIAQRLVKQRDLDLATIPTTGKVDQNGNETVDQAAVQKFAKKFLRIADQATAPNGSGQPSPTGDAVARVCVW